MYLVTHGVAQGGVYHAMTGHGIFAAKLCGNDGHREVSTPAACSGVPGVQVALVDHFQGIRGERGGESLADQSDPVHGSVDALIGLHGNVPVNARGHIGIIVGPGAGRLQGVELGDDDAATEAG